MAATGKRLKATKAQKLATSAALQEHYDKMAAAASEVVLHNRGKPYREGKIAHVLFVFPHWVKFGDGFPRGVIVGKTLITNTYKINAVKLLDWLYKAGKCKYNASLLVKETTRLEVMLRKIERLF